MRKHILFSIISLLLCAACSHKEKVAQGATFIFPEDTQAVFRINDKNNFLSAIANNAFWKERNPQSLNSYETKLVQSVPTNADIWVAFSTGDHFTVIAKKNTSDKQSLWKEADSQVKRQTQFGKEWYYLIYDGYLIISSSENVAIYTQLKDKPLTENQKNLQQLQKVGGTNCVANLFIKKDRANDFFKVFFGSEVVKNTKDWVQLDLSLEENDIRFSGTALIAKDSTSVDPLLHTLPYQNRVLAALPSSITALTSYTFEDGEKLTLSDKNALNSPFRTSINGVSIAKSPQGQFAITSCFDVDEALQQLPVLSEDLQYNFPMYELNGELPFKFFTAFAEGFVPRYVGVSEQCLIFTPTKELLIAVMSDIQRGDVLTANKAYDLLEKHIASNVSLTRITNLYDTPAFSAAYPAIAQNYRWAVFQQTPQNDYYVLNFVCKHQTESTLSDEMRERFRFTVDAEMITPPTIVLNHRTKLREIVVQDANFNFYLIGNNGSLLWKKKLDGKITSPIKQVDLFKNGFLQMAFTTEKSVWILDRNGNVVAPFPLSYKERISPLEVFDYERNREYRFLFAEGTTLHLLDRKGQQVSGFFSRTNGKPLFTPRHFRFNQKDYLVYPSDNGTFNILHRNGETRIPVKQQFKFSDNPPLCWNNNFVFSTANGALIHIDEGGKIRQEDKKLSENNYLVGNTYVFTLLSGNQLSIGDKTFTLPEGNYDRPRLFRIRSINYVTLNDKKQQKAYLYDENGTLIKDFPLESVSPIDIDVDYDKSVWIVTEKTPTELILYTLKDFRK